MFTLTITLGIPTSRGASFFGGFQTSDLAQYGGYS